MGYVDWVNAEDSKRAYESRDDAYRVFRKMLDSGHPPDDWEHKPPDPSRQHRLVAPQLLGPVHGLVGGLEQGFG